MLRHTLYLVGGAFAMGGVVSAIALGVWLGLTMASKVHM